MFLEPESGLGWYDRDGDELELVLGVQSPYEATESIAFLLGQARPPFKPTRINTQFTYIGGGFGGRDHTPFVLYVALAAMFFPGRPVRLAHDRYQQFQGGIKRHAIKMRSRIAVDRATGKIEAFAADHVLDGGGLAHFSSSVAVVAATAAIGIYDIPKVDITTVALHTRGVTAGSMRGYGTLQTMTALEVLIDEAASALPLDPIEFRRRNALPPQGRTMTGNPYSVSVRTTEILDKLEQHPIWQQRALEKKPRTANRDLCRHGRCLRHQGLRERRGLLARTRGSRRGRPNLDPLRSCRDGQWHRNRACQPCGHPSRWRGRRSVGGADRHLRFAGARQFR
jgi:CO/xanthine dehydrogenase Mo-binding subunit